LHKVGDLLKVKKDELLFIHLKYEKFERDSMICAVPFNEGDSFRISKIDNEHIYMKKSDDEIYYIRQKDIDDFLINVRSLRKDKLDNIFKR